MRPLTASRKGQPVLSGERFVTSYDSQSVLSTVRRVATGEEEIRPDKPGAMVTHTGASAQIPRVGGCLFLDHHVRELRVIYRERRDAMLTALTIISRPGRLDRAPGGPLCLGHAAANPRCHHCVTGRPGCRCGLCSWHRVLFAHDGGQHMMRLNFTCMGPDRIEEGMGAWEGCSPPTWSRAPETGHAWGCHSSSSCGRAPYCTSSRWRRASKASTAVWPYPSGHGGAAQYGHWAHALGRITQTLLRPADVSRPNLQRPCI